MLTVVTLTDTFDMFFTSSDSCQKSRSSETNYQFKIAPLNVRTDKFGSIEL